MARILGGHAALSQHIGESLEEFQKTRNQQVT